MSPLVTSETAAGPGVDPGSGTRRWMSFSARSRLAPLVVAFCGPLVAAAVMITVRAHVANTGLALIMVAVVVAAVAPGRRAAAVVAGISAGVWFDFFLTKPYESFTMNRSADQETTALLIVVALAVGEIAARSRRYHTDTVDAWSDLAGIAKVTEALAGTAGPGEIIEAVRAGLISLLVLEACSFDAGGTQRTTPFLDRNGSVNYNHFARDASREGLPNKEVTLPVEAEGRLVGRYLLRGPALGVPIGRDRLLTAVVLADLAGIAISRHSLADTQTHFG